MNDDPRNPRSGLTVLLALAGLAIAFAGAVTYFTIFARFPALRDVPWLNLPLALAGAAIAVFAATLAFRRRAAIAARLASGAIAALAVLLAALLGAYVFWISYQVPPETEVARELRIAPDVRLVASDGTPFAFGDLRGRKVLVVFYRGFW